MEDVQYDGSGEPLRYPDPVQGGNEKVTRQTGLSSWQQEVRDPAPVQPVIQGDHHVVATRQKGSGTQHFDASGTLIADTRADDRSVLYVDVATMAAGDANPPGPGIARAALTPTNVPTPGRITAFASDDGASNDDRDPGGPPRVFGAAELPTIKKAPVVPIDMPTPKTKKGGRK